MLLVLKLFLDAIRSLAVAKILNLICHKVTNILKYKRLCADKNRQKSKSSSSDGLNTKSSSKTPNNQKTLSKHCSDISDFQCHSYNILRLLHNKLGRNSTSDLVTDCFVTHCFYAAPLHHHINPEPQRQFVLL